MQKRKVTIQDIADKANVSKSTVSRVLNDSSLVKESKRDAVLEAMKTLDFQPNQLARGLAGGKSLTIGVMTQDIGSPFYDVVAQSVTTALSETIYSPIFVDGRWNAEIEAAGIDTLLGRRVDGIIIIGGSLPDSDLKLIKDVPVVVVAREVAGWEENSIVIDNLQGSYDATKYLIDCGHKKIAFITGIATHQDAIQRKQGFIRALNDAGLEVDHSLCLEGNFRPDSGEEVVEKLLQRKAEFTAIYASNDEMAFGARLALYRRGIKVPEEVSIVGFDDQPMSAFMTPPLTTVRQPAVELGVVATELVVHLLSGEAYKRPELKTELIVRESVAKR